MRRAVPALRFPAVPYDHGRSQIVADLGTALGLALYRYGWSDPDLDLTRQLLSPGGLFVDGGANIGLFTLVAAARVTASGKVIAFEPAPTTFEVLRRNTTLNGLSWVDLRREALADQRGERDLVTFSGDGAGMSSFHPARSAEGKLERVQTVPLDEAIPAEDWARLQLVKLDLEGAELAALRGASQLLAARHPDLIVEIEPDHLQRQGGAAEVLIGLLRDHGYTFFRIGSAGGAPTLTVEPAPAARRERPNLFATVDLARASRAGVSVR